MAEPDLRDRPRTLRPSLSGVVTVAAGLLVWLALVVPSDARDLSPGGFLRVPGEVPAVVLMALLLRARVRRLAAVAFGVVLALVVLLKLLDVGFHVVFDRPFDALNDWYYLRPGLGVLADQIGRPGALVVAALAAGLAAAIVILTPMAVLRLTGLVARHRGTSMRAASALGVAWILCIVSGLQSTPSASGVVYDQVSRVRADLKDRHTFAKAIATDTLRDAPDDRTLAGLRGKDVLLVFVESYGRVAVEGSSLAPPIDVVLDSGTKTLAKAGFASRSAFLTSPTFGAGSWLAHASLQSGLWVDSQQRYNQLVTGERRTLTGIFGRAGWRTVFDVPANTKDWPEGSSFYGFDKLYDARNVGYRGPKFGYASMPDQYILSEFQRRELAPVDRPDVMAEIDLVSSHHPWAPLPTLVDWDEVGDGSVFRSMLDGSGSSGVSDPDEVRAAYGRSIEYSLSSIISFVRAHPDPDLVLIVLGDHQPHRYVTGDAPGHDVPITIIAHDPAVMDRISSWGWQDGMRPHPDAPVWRMDRFRDRFLDSYGPRP
jgi:hypothetical protein